MKAILSTKIVSKSQKELLLNTNLSFVEYDAIHIEFLKPQFPKQIENGIVTSQNAFRAIKSLKPDVNNWFCVGEKTKSLLEKNEQKVIKMNKNASELANFIIENYKNEEFVFFCGNKRRSELPSILNKKNIRFTEVETYKTHLNSKKFVQEFDGILFFSPSGVESYSAINKVENSIAFCIGETTANTAREHFKKVRIAKTPTVESVIELVNEGN